MGILVERRLRRRQALALELPFRDRRKAQIHAPRRGWIEIGFVNNMPDPALESTERHFLRLLRLAAIGRPVRVRYYALTELPRSQLGKRRLDALYSDASDLYEDHIDGLIVTGTEPRTAALADEPYWSTLSQIFDWAEENTVGSIWSCLAAHAAVLHLDGVARHPLAQKCSGVFDCSRISDHPLMRRVPARFPVPHSRANGLSETELAACGYQLLSRSADAGLDAFLKERRSLCLFLQGHPEYEADTLFREYRRDVGRFLRGERDGYPQFPSGYFDADATAAFEAFREQAARTRDEALLATFPSSMIPRGLAQKWQQPGARMYRNWLAFVAARRKRQSVAPAAVAVSARLH